VIDVPFLRCWSLLRHLEAFGIVITIAFCESTLVSHSLLKPLISCFLHLLSSKSLLGLACLVTLDGLEGWSHEFQQAEDEEC
jgi:hypothetical protein